jgi:hypothetical protein
LFRTILIQHSDKELQQFDEQIRFERDTLDIRINDERKQSSTTWKKMQKTRNKQFKQQFIVNKVSSEEEKDLIRKVLFDRSNFEFKY